MNSKRYFLCIKRKWKSLILTLLICTAVCAGIYEISYTIKTKHVTYESEAIYYLTAGEQEVFNYYNSYTWNDIIKSDTIVDNAMEMLNTLSSCTLSKEELAGSLQADIVSDLRFLIVTSTCDSELDANHAILGVTYALSKLPDEVEEFEAITLWSQKSANVVQYENLIGQAVLLGILLGLLGWIVVISIYYAVEDSIYVESDVADYTEIPVLGFRLKKANEICDKMLATNLKAVSETEILGSEISLDQDNEWDMEAWKGKTLILTVLFGNRNGKKLSLFLEQCKLHKIQVAGIIITNADNKFMKQYYHIS